MRGVALPLWALFLATAPARAEDAPADAIPVDVAESAEGSVRNRRTLDVPEAAALLSRYPSGQVPVDLPVLRAISALEMSGTTEEISLLQHLARHEQPAIAAAADRAVTSIQARERTSMLRNFALTLPDERDLEVATWRARGLGPAEAACAAYADGVLGDAEPAADPEGALDAGNVRAALAGWAQEASSGDARAHARLVAFGIDAERLLVGLLHARALTDARPVETLIRQGERWTVRVFAERTRGPSASEQATAADALGRMLDVSFRATPLPPRERDLARRALAAASQHAAPPVRPIALEALQAARPSP